MKTDKRRFRRIFASFYGSYLLALCLPVLICSLAYKITSDSITINIQRYATVSLNQMLGQIDAKTSEIQDVSYRVANDMLTQSTSILGKDDRGELSFGMTRYVRQLWPVWFTNNGTISRMYVYFNRSGIVASPFTFYDADDFYDTFFTYGNMDAQEFYGTLMNKRNNITYLEPDTVALYDMNNAAGRRKAVLFIRQIIPENSTKPMGAVFSLIDSDWIKNKLAEILPPTGGYAAVMDSLGRVVAEAGTPGDFTAGEIEEFRKGDSADISGGSIVVRIVSGQTGWKYLAAGRKSILLAEADKIIRLFAAILALAVAAGAAVCAWLAYAKSRPVARLTGLFDSFEGSGRHIDSFSLIETGIGRIMDSNRSLSETVERQRPLLASLFLHRLITGDFGDEGDIPAAARDMGVDIPSGVHVIVLARLNSGRGAMGREEIIRAGRGKRLVHEALEQAAGCPVQATDPSLAEVAWLFTSPVSGEAADAALADVLAVASDILKKQEVACLFAVGSYFEQLSGACKSYREALSAADWATPGADIPLLWYWNPHAPGERYEYRLETEDRLISFIHGGDKDAVHTVLETIRRENIEDRSLTAVMKRLLIGDMEATLVKAVEHGRSDTIERLLLELDEIDDPDARFDHLCRAIEESCSLYSVQRQSSSLQLTLRIRGFIENHYGNPDLGLKMLSVETGITEAYLSRVFKENTGGNFATFVERIRIDAACRLLAKPSCSVASVAEAVGYNSDHVFRRAFKRVTGMNPAEYRHGLGLE